MDGVVRDLKRYIVVGFNHCRDFEWWSTVQRRLLTLNGS